VKKIFVSLMISISVCSFVFARDREMKYPGDCTVERDRMEYNYIAQETLRREHNTKGKDFREGKITKAEWDTYTLNEFRPRQVAISEQIVNQKTRMKASTRWIVDTDTDIPVREVIK